MRLGMVGLGRMGWGMTQRLRGRGHEVVGFDFSPEHRDAASVADLVAALPAPRAVWVMVPSGPPTEATVVELAGLLAPGDLVVDGGNSNFHDSVRRGQLLAERGIFFIDAGVSGGIWGLQEGFCLMVGGRGGEGGRHAADLRCPRPRGRVRALRAGGRRPLHQDGPQRDRVRDDAGLRRGVRAAGGKRAGHQHHRRRHRVGLRERHPQLAARTAGGRPGRGPRSWSGSGPTWRTRARAGGRCRRRSVSGVPANVLSASLFARFTSRQDDSPAMKVLALLRHGFGGHAVKSAGASPD